MPSTYRAELRQSIIAFGSDAQELFTALDADPTNEAGTAIVVATESGVVTVPMSNVLAIIETTS